MRRKPLSPGAKITLVAMTVAALVVGAATSSSTSHHVAATVCITEPLGTAEACGGEALKVCRENDGQDDSEPGGRFYLLHERCIPVLERYGTSMEVSLMQRLVSEEQSLSH
jgi:hypothetical protein